MSTIHLRIPEPADAPMIAQGVGASLAELKPWMPWATDNYDEWAALAWINGEFGDVHRFVILDEQDHFLGNIALNNLDKLNRCANLGYWIHSGHTGKGVATEATKQLARYGFQKTDLARLEILMSVNNEASRRVAEKAGAHYEGVAKKRVHLLGEQHDAHVFSFTRQT